MPETVPRSLSENSASPNKKMGNYCRFSSLFPPSKIVRSKTKRSGISRLPRGCSCRGPRLSTTSGRRRILLLEEAVVKAVTWLSQTSSGSWGEIQQGCSFLPGLGSSC